MTVATYSVLSARLDDLPISVRTRNALYAGLKAETVADIACLSEPELLYLPNFGRKALNEIKELFSNYGIRLAKDRPVSKLEHLSTLIGRVHARKAAYDQAVRELSEFQAAILEETP